MKLRFQKNIHLCELYWLIFTILEIQSEKKKLKYIVATALIPAGMPTSLPTIAFTPPVPVTNTVKKAKNMAILLWK